MTLKTLLLGSAAAFAVVGGAQAADLSVAEPVESVKVCDLFGGGYWYIPGSDTCLKVSGHVQFDVNLHGLAQTQSADGTNHSSNWDFQTSIGIGFDANSMTDVGALKAHVGLKGTYNGQNTANEFNANSQSVKLDGATISLGALTVGHTGSVFNPDSTYMDDYGLAAVIKSSIADSNQIQLAWAAAGFGLALGIEDPRETWASALPIDYSMPQIAGRISMSQGMVSGRLSAAGVQLSGGTAWGVDGEVTFNIGANDWLRINAAYGDNTYTGGGVTTSGYTPSNNGWSAFASFRHMFSPTMRMDLDGSYLVKDSVNGGGAASWKAGADLVWLPYAGFKAKAGVAYSQVVSAPSGTWMAQVSLRRDW